MSFDVGFGGGVSVFGLKGGVAITLVVVYTNVFVVCFFAGGFSEGLY